MSNRLPKLSVIYMAECKDTTETDTQPEDIKVTFDADGFYPVVEYEKSIDSILCRICYGYDSLENLLSPCNCKGSIAYVHRDCLEMGLSLKGKAICDLCCYQFDAIYTLKYSLMQSIWVWITDSNTRLNFWLDFFSYFMLNIATIALFGITIQSMDLFLHRNLLRNTRDVVTVTMTYGISMFCSFVMLFIHFMGSITFARYQILAWFYWWRNSFDIRLKN